MHARAALLVLLGLAIGIVGSVFALRALGERNPFPTAVMDVMAHHMGALSHGVKAKQCPAPAIREHLARLQSTAADIPAAFGDGDPDFTAAATRLRDALQQANDAHPADCAALGTALKPVGDACKSCHEQYR